MNETTNKYREDSARSIAFLTEECSSFAKDLAELKTEVKIIKFQMSVSQGIGKWIIGGISGVIGTVIGGVLVGIVLYLVIHKAP